MEVQAEDKGSQAITRLGPQKVLAKSFYFRTQPIRCRYKKLFWALLWTPDAILLPPAPLAPAPCLRSQTEFWEKP